jgi:beta-phosphoglucomutase-like phosphatase (HAD superfamily)
LHPQRRAALTTRDRLDGAAFDLDGVLTNTALVHEAAWKQVFEAFLSRQPSGGFAPFTSDDYRLYVDGRPRSEGIKAFLASRGFSLSDGHASDGLDQDTIQGLGRRKNKVFLDLVGEHGVEVYPDAVDLVRRLRAASFRTAVVSASKNCRAVLQAAGIAGLFDATVDGLDGETLG